MNHDVFFLFGISFEMAAEPAWFRGDESTHPTEPSAVFPVFGLPPSQTKKYETPKVR